MEWQITLSKDAKGFLEAMKELAFFAFLKQYARKLFNLLNFLVSFDCDESNATCISEDAPVMVFQAVILVLILFILLLLCAIGKVSTKLQGCY